MSVTRLAARRVEKPWGRRDLLPPFGSVAEDAGPIGEIWFEDPRGGDGELLVKYLFTSEKLSIQVHPDDESARRRGHRFGKEEAWVILDAEADASIGIGLRAPIGAHELRQAAIDGAIEEMIEWHPVRRGDVYYSPAGTIHSIGAGLKLIEVQQNADVTYRLYDFGRPRELHLDEAVAAAAPQPFRPPFEPYEAERGRRILAEGLKFVLERWTGRHSARLGGSPDLPFWVIAVSSGGAIAGEPIEAGAVWLVEGQADLELAPDSDVLLAYPGPALRNDPVAADRG